MSEKPKSRTDTNFYENEVRSNKPPSSRPPLSGRSGKSKSTSKEKVVKQTTIPLNANTGLITKNTFKKVEAPPKKMTLMQRALMKHHESEEDSQSQGSFSSREDFSQNSQKSSNSKGSRKSVKESSISLNRKEGSVGVGNQARPPQQKVSSNSSNH